MTHLPSPSLDRRAFAFGLTSLAFSGLVLSGCATSAGTRKPGTIGYGTPVPDPAGLIDLPPGFSYRVISTFGDRMDDGFVVPDNADGMGAFAIDRHRVALVRNHELRLKNAANGPFRSPSAVTGGFDRFTGGDWLPGGTTTLIYDERSGRVERQHLSLIGTIRNCAGGTTPWGSWLTCEEDVSRAGNGIGQDHGWVFEVPAAHKGLVEAVPLKAMGRFNHEAAAVDPRTGVVYLTEDRDDSLLYRFLPEQRGELARGGRLQALAFADRALGTDSRNWDAATFPAGQWRDTAWIDLDGVDSANDDLRLRGNAAGAVRFARGEGIHFGDGELYFCCTSGGAAKLSQVMRYRPSIHEGRTNETSAPGRLQLFVESTDPASLNYGDNLTVAPTGHLIVCEDQYTDVVDNHLRGITPKGEIYALARLRIQTEFAGVCFSPSGRTMFVNLYSPGKTLAITGPW